MKLARKSTSYHVTPVGLHHARCFSIIEIGTNEGTFNGKTVVIPKVVAQFEILDWNDGYGNIPIVNQIYTISSHPKSRLRRVMELLKGRKFTSDELDEIETKWMVGQHCILNIFHVESNGYTNAKIADVLPVSASTSLPDPVYPDRIFTVETPDLDVFRVLPIWIRKMIQGSAEWPHFKQVDGWQTYFDNVQDAANNTSYLVG
jgi:hypothetical protein